MLTARYEEVSSFGNCHDFLAGNSVEGAILVHLNVHIKCVFEYREKQRKIKEQSIIFNGRVVSSISMNGCSDA
jgi:hypothetical protein